MAKSLVELSVEIVQAQSSTKNLTIDELQAALKDTFENIKLVPEVVINTVSYSMVQQASLSSTEYPTGVNEFIKSGLTPLPSDIEKPFRVKESPVQFECRVRDIIETGDQGGAGNLVICDILLIHVDEEVMDDNGKIDPNKIDLVGRLGGDYYSRTSGESVFMVEKPLQKLGIGIDQLPDKIKHSPYLSGNDLGKLGNIEHLPTVEILKEYKSNSYLEKTLIQKPDSDEKARVVTNIAKNLLEDNQVQEAILVLMGYL